LKLTIGRRILLGYSLATLFITIAAVIAYLGVENLFDANARLRHTFRTVTAAQEIRSDLLGIRGDYMGYLLNGNAHFLRTIGDLQRHMVDSQRTLRTLTVDNNAQQKRLDVLVPLIGQRLSRLAYLSNMRKEGGLTAVLLEMRQTTGADLTGQILSSLDEIENEERSLLDAREKSAESKARNVTRIIVYGTLGCFAMLALLAITTRFSITQRLGEFQQLVAFVKQGDLTQQSAPGGSDEMGQLAEGMNEIVARLRNMASQTRLAASSLALATGTILESAQDQTIVTTEQIAVFQQTSVTMQQVSQSGLQIAERAKKVTMSAEAVSIANTSGLDAVQRANQTVEAIHEQAEAVAQNIVALSEKTQLVGDILATVNDIAEQSHLLALNAAIEAAAAGEHGRTFSVVAGEIKNLADQSKAATVQVKTILVDIQKEINTSVMLTEEAVKRVDLGRLQADAAASAIRDMAANIDQSVEAFQQIVAGTNQQQIGFDNVMKALKDMIRASEQSTSSNRQTEKAAANLYSVRTQLQLATEGYRL
jgi:methyl-accepting chemotaxis protein